MKCIRLLLLFSSLILSGCVILPGAKERTSQHPDGFRKADHYVRVNAVKDRFHVKLSGLGRDHPAVRLISGNYRSSRGSAGNLRFANSSFSPNVGTFDFDLLVPGARAEYSRPPELLPFRDTYTVDFTYSLNGVAHQVHETIFHRRPVQLVPLIPLHPDWGMNE